MRAFAFSLILALAAPTIPADEPVRVLGYACRGDQVAAIRLLAPRPGTITIEIAPDACASEPAPAAPAAPPPPRRGMVA